MKTKNLKYLLHSTYLVTFLVSTMLCMCWPLISTRWRFCKKNRKYQFCKQNKKAVFKVNKIFLLIFLREKKVYILCGDIHTTPQCASLVRLWQNNDWSENNSIYIKKISRLIRIDPFFMTQTSDFLSLLGFFLASFLM